MISYGLVAESVAYARGNMEGLSCWGLCARDAVSNSNLVLGQRANPLPSSNRGLSGCHATALICAVISISPHRELPGQETLELRVETHRRIDEVGSIKTELA